MKTSKSPEKTEVTPSKKKLKQARLPFKLITDVLPKPDEPQLRKRKLSVPDNEPLTKVGKICKENDLSDDLVVISDDESKVETGAEKVEKIPNPYVKIVDNARKKKLQKAKALKKSKSKSKKVETPSIEQTTSDHSYDDIEMVDVEVIIHENPTPVIGENPSSEDIANSIEKPRLSSDNEDSISLSSKDSTAVVDDNRISGEKLDNSNNHRIKNPTPVLNKDTVSEKKGIESPKKTNSVICLDKSRNSCDVQSKASPGNDSENKTENTQNEDSKPKVENEVSKSENDDLKTNPETQNNVTPKRSTRIKQNTIQLALKTAEEKADKNSGMSSKNDDQTSQSSENDQSTSVNDSSLAGTDNSQSTENNKKNNDTEITKKDTNEAQNNLTPKRTRTKAKDDEKATLNVSVVSSKLDDSICSSPVTPKQDTSMTTNLTPKQLQKRLESAKKKEEREKEKQDREKKRQEEKEERAKQRQEKLDLLRKEREDKEEAKKKEREEKEELRKKEREEKEKQRELEKKQKEEEKRKEKESKEEQRKKEKEARDEEKRKRQEALDLEKQEQELKKKKAAEAFANFFVPKQKNDKDQSIAPSRTNMLSSFTIKGDMRLAPTIRADLTDEKREALDKYMNNQGLSELYLKCLRDGKVKPQTSEKTWPLSDKDDDDVMIVEDELPPLDGTGEIITCDTAPREKLRPKLFSFHENRRPPYWGTWRKKSVWVKPRRPFGQEKILDYEVDSDEDWEEEQDGESLDGSACGSEEDGDRDDYEVDNELFVPHGYLSDEEATMNEDDVLSLSPETQKARLKHLEDEFESEMKKPTEKIKPRMYGLLWESNGGKPDQCVDSLWNYFTKFSMIIDIDNTTPFFQPSKEPEETEKKKIKKKKVEGEEPTASPKSEKKKKVKPESKEGRKAKAEPKKIVANQPGINSFLFSKVKSA